MAEEGQNNTNPIGPEPPKMDDATRRMYAAAGSIVDYSKKVKENENEKDKESRHLTERQLAKKAVRKAWTKRMFSERARILSGQIRSLEKDIKQTKKDITAKEKKVKDKRKEAAGESLGVCSCCSLGLFSPAFILVLAAFINSDFINLIIDKAIEGSPDQINGPLTASFKRARAELKALKGYQEHLIERITTKRKELEKI